MLPHPCTPTCLPIHLKAAALAGCEHCSAGYKGRVGIYEVMKMSDEIARTIMEGGNSLQIASQAKAQGMRDLRQSGLLKVIHGVTSIAEVNRVTSFG